MSTEYIAVENKQEDCRLHYNFVDIHSKKSFSIFPSPAGMSLTKLTLGGNNDVMYKLSPPRESLVSDIKWFTLSGAYSRESSRKNRYGAVGMDPGKLIHN
jgi:hypothetical protein